MWPSLETAERIGNYGNLGLVISLVVGLVATCAIVWTTRIKERHWDTDRRASDERIEALRNANLRLEKQIAPRIITVEQADQLKAAATSPFKVEFALSGMTDEDISLGNGIAGALEAAGWRRVNWPFPGAMPLPTAPNIGRVVLNGIQVQPLNAKLNDLTDALVATLGTMEFGHVRKSEEKNMPSDETGPMMLLIMIGARR